MKKYERVTPIGVWTGKVMIGGHYLPKPRAMTANEYLIQGLVRGKGLPIERRLGDLYLKVRSMFRRPL